MHADGQGLVAGGETAGHGKPGDPGDVAGDGKHIAEVHLQGVSGFFTGFEGGGRGGRAEDHIAFFKRLIEVALDERFGLQGAEVVGIVVAAGEGVGADHDAALDFLAETFRAGFAEEIDDVVDRLFGAVPEVYAIIAGKIAGGFAGGDDVVRGDAVFGVGE